MTSLPSGHEPGPDCPHPSHRRRDPVWLVVMDHGGLFGVYLDRERADQAARDVDGVLAQLPVVADYRPGTAGEVVPGRAADPRHWAQCLQMNTLGACGNSAHLEHRKRKDPEVGWTWEYTAVRRVSKPTRPRRPVVGWQGGACPDCRRTETHSTGCTHPDGPGVHDRVQSSPPE